MSEVDSVTSFLFLVPLSPSAPVEDKLSLGEGMNRTWMTFMSGNWPAVWHDGPCSPARTSQIIFLPICGRKCFSHARFMLSIVISSSSSKGTNSRGPIRVYFWAFPETEADNRWTVSSSFVEGRLVSLEAHLFNRLAFIFSLNFFHAWSAMTPHQNGMAWWELSHPAQDDGSGNARPIPKFTFRFTFILFALFCFVSFRLFHVFR